MQNIKYSSKPKNPILKSSFLGRLFFTWTIGIFKIGAKRTIAQTDIYETLEKYDSKLIEEEFSMLWNEELLRQKPSMFRLFVRAFGPSLFVIGQLWTIFETFARVLQPLCLAGLLSYFLPDQIGTTKSEAYFYATGLIISSLAPSFLYHTFIFYTITSGMKMRLGCSLLIYKKILKLSKSTSYDGMNGQVINLLTNDVSRFETAFSYLHDTTKGPMEAIVFSILIYRELGYAGMIGLSMICCLIPFQVYLAKKTASYRLKTAKRTDIRIKFMNEIIHAIQVIKMYAWEIVFGNNIANLRRKEINAIRGNQYITATLNSFIIISKLSIFSSLILYVFFGNILTARKVFLYMMLSTYIHDSLVHFWPKAIKYIAEALVSLKRVEEFLLRPESKESALGDRIFNDDEIGIEFKDVTSIWDKTEPNNGIFDINLKIVPKKLCMIIGAVGSGKSTLLNIIAGELNIDQGELNIQGSISYAPQEPWLFFGTIKQNILFIEDWNEQRYKEVCRVCALERDFELLPHGDKTMVGERGVILSGGQKARISLARTIYKSSDIYLLDDPLSAVDNQVGKLIFTECIQNFLKDKCVVLVTHQLKFLQNSEQIILIENGKIKFNGNFNNIKNNYNKFHLIAEKMKSLKNIEIFDEPNLKKTKIKDESEKLLEGSVKLSVYGKYFKSIQSGFYLFNVITLFILAELFITGIDYYIAQWINWEEMIHSNGTAASNETNSFLFVIDLSSSEESSRHQFILYYGIFLIFLSYVIIHRNFAFYSACLRSSINLHDKLFRSVIRATMNFFNKNPSGYILNRFSKDIGAIDIVLPDVLFELLKLLLHAITIIIIVGVVNPWLLLPSFIMTVLFYFIGKIFIKTSRCINRIESLSRSPMYSHINATIQGLSTIRVLKAQNILSTEFYDHQNNNTSALYLYFATTRAFAVCLDLLCVAYNALVIYSLLFIEQNYLVGNVGFIITQIMVLISTCQWGIRSAAEFENRMVSVERISEYTDLLSEPALETDPKYKLDKNWPEFGSIEFQNVNLRYTEQSDFVLKKLNFKINSKEKIGIVGRTGAGKSSIIQALFRLAETDGIIKIDNIDIKTLGLHNLRSKIGIIPQDPILFSGSMRYNLDPLEEKKDYDLWEALAQVELKDFIQSMAGGLNCFISDGGTNFSLGQRQLVCLARALIQKTKILVLDEATANVDPDTDKLIQATIRKNFQDCTVLTIAHRLDTVVDSDRILVLDAGEIVEFDEPSKLVFMNGFFNKESLN